MSIARKCITILVIICAGTLLWWAVRGRGPRYEGHTVSYWLSRLGSSNWGKQVEARRAFRNMGATAVPSLIAELQREESPFQRKFKTYARRVPLLNRFVSPTIIETGTPQGPAISSLQFHFLHQYAVRALGEIGPAASNAIPVLQANAGHISPPIIRAALMKIRNEPNTPLTFTATNLNASLWWLDVSVAAEFHEESQALVPHLCRALWSGDLNQVEIAAEALGRIHSNPDIVIPALMNAVYRLEGKPANNGGLTFCYWALGQFQREATPAVPVLRQCLTNSGSMGGIRCSALRSLSQILPPEETRKLLTQALNCSDLNLKLNAKSLLDDMNN